MKFGIVNRSDDSIFPYQAWPTVARDENGVLYVVASSHRVSHICPFGQNHMYISRDEGKTWSAPIVINNTMLDDRDAGLVCLGDGKLLMTFFNHPIAAYQNKYRKFIENNTNDLNHDMTMGLLNKLDLLPPEDDHPGSFLRVSHDGGMTWDARIKAPVTSPHGPIKLKSGKLLWLGRQFHTEGYEDAVYAFESSDEGKTWDLLSRVPDVENFEAVRFSKNDFPCEPDAVELEDGTLLGFIRLKTNIKGVEMTTYATRSEDGGRTWSTPAPTGEHGAPAHVIRHSSGALVMVYSYRMPPCGERARVSYDNGKTWSRPVVISETSPTWDCGYPSSVELSDGSILTVYYQHYKDDKFNSILFTNWTLDEVKE